jgi:hypothetical protein
MGAFSDLTGTSYLELTMQFKQPLMQRPVTALVSTLGLTLGLTGALLLASANPGQSCIFGKRQSTDSALTSSPGGDIGAQISATSGDPSGKLVKAGLVAAGGLGIVLAGTALKRKLKHQQPVPPVEGPTLGADAADASEAALMQKLSSSFPIVVPREALSSNLQVGEIEREERVPVYSR